MAHQLFDRDTNGDDGATRSAGVVGRSGGQGVAQGQGAAGEHEAYHGGGSAWRVLRVVQWATGVLISSAVHLTTQPISH